MYNLLQFSPMKEDCFGSRNGMHGEIVQCSRKKAHSTGEKTISANKKEMLFHTNWSQLHQGFVIIPKGEFYPFSKKLSVGQGRHTIRSTSVLPVSPSYRFMTCLLLRKDVQDELSGYDKSVCIRQCCAFCHRFPLYVELHQTRRIKRRAAEVNLGNRIEGP